MGERQCVGAVVAAAAAAARVSEAALATSQGREAVHGRLQAIRPSSFNWGNVRKRV